MAPSPYWGDVVRHIPTVDIIKPLGRSSRGHWGATSRCPTPWCALCRSPVHKQLRAEGYTKKHSRPSSRASCSGPSRAACSSVCSGSASATTASACCQDDCCTSASLVEGFGCATSSRSSPMPTVTGRVSPGHPPSRQCQSPSVQGDAMPLPVACPATPEPPAKRRGALGPRAVAASLPKRLQPAELDLEGVILAEETRTTTFGLSPPSRAASPYAEQVISPGLRGRSTPFGSRISSPQGPQRPWQHGDVTTHRPPTPSDFRYPVVLRGAEGTLPSADEEDERRSQQRREFELKRTRLASIAKKQGILRRRQAAAALLREAAAKAANEQTEQDEPQEEPRIPTPDTAQVKKHLRMARVSLLARKVDTSTTQKRMAVAATPSERKEPVGVQIQSLAKQTQRRQSEAQHSQEVAKHCAIVDVHLLGQHCYHQDVNLAMEAFQRYDEDGSGTLELNEIRSVLRDAGLFPTSAEEKAGVRKTLAKFAQGLSDSESGESFADGTGTEPTVNFSKDWRAGIPASEQSAKSRAQQESHIRSVNVNRDRLPDLMMRVRRRLRKSRRRRRQDIFNKFDVLSIGTVELSAVLDILMEMDIIGKDDAEKEAFASWLASVGPQVAGTPQRIWEELSRSQISFPEFNIILDHLQEVRVRQESAAKLSVALELGVKSSTIASQFWSDMENMKALFFQYDVNKTGLLDLPEVWLCLGTLGLIPQSEEEKTVLLDMVRKSYESPGDTQVHSRRPDRVGTFLEQRRNCISMELMRREGQWPPAFSDLKAASEDMETEMGGLSFQGFLEIVTTLRSWNQDALKEELAPLLNIARHRRSPGESGLLGDESISLKEACHILETLGLSPRTEQEQLQIKALLEDANEWGFEPVAIDIQAFARLVDQLRERHMRLFRDLEIDTAANLGLPKQMVNKYRVAWDVLDKSGSGELDIHGVRKLTSLMSKTLSADRLRELMSTYDCDENGFISFREFLCLMMELDDDLEAPEVKNPEQNVPKEEPARPRRISLQYSPDELQGKGSKHQHSLG